MLTVLSTRVILDLPFFISLEVMRIAPLTPLLRTAARSQYKNTLIKSFAASQTRQFNLPSLSSFAPQFSAPEPRSLSATRTLPFAPSPLFQTISSIDSYKDFLPFLTESKVTARDPKTGYPTRAYLTIGYGPLSETFESKVECDEKKWFVGARSGDIALQHKQNQGAGGSSSQGECIFEHLDTIWKLEPLNTGMNGGHRTKVDLTVRFQFRSPLHAAMMTAVESQMAGLMIEAFEKRMIEGGKR
ncbi:Coenzyme Q-binding protein coq10, mitochondrial [Microsporum canis]